MNSSFFEQENIQSKMKNRLSWTGKHWFQTYASVKVYEVSDVQKLWITKSTSKDIMSNNEATYKANY